MTMMGWRFMYWLFFAVGVTGVLAAAALLLAANRRRTRVLIATAIALIFAGLSGTLIVAAAGPGGFGHNMMGMGGMGMTGTEPTSAPHLPPPPEPQRNR
ncbi:MAG: hypothetical protein ACRDKS_03205 [Actinomycetota bacterium]